MRPEVLLDQYKQNRLSKKNVEKVKEKVDIEISDDFNALIQKKSTQAKNYILPAALPE
jgi:hypothetical protein